MDLQKNLNALVILIIAGVLLSGFAVQLIKHEEPCVLCMLQRLAMIAVAASLTLNLRFGIRPNHYGLGLVAAIFGQWIALRHIALHVCPDFPPSTSTPVFGLSLFTWSLIIFACCQAAIALLLFLRPPKQEKGRLSPLCTAAATLIFLVTATNIITTFMKCGFTAC
jgi:disulfide bond formation protein DsbB